MTIFLRADNRAVMLAALAQVGMTCPDADDVEQVRDCGHNFIASDIGTVYDADNVIDPESGLPTPEHTGSHSAAEGYHVNLLMTDGSAPPPSLAHLIVDPPPRTPYEVFS
jgi:hypothetical protein